MKRALSTSLLANVFLLILLAAVLRRSQLPRGSAPKLPPIGSATVSKGTPSSARVSEFSWKQIESTDYQVYIRNLRSIGCPESTIADIIRADIHALYSGKRAELGLAAQSASALWSQAEENRVLKVLLGGKPPQTTEDNRPVPKAPVLPLALHQVDLAGLGLDPGQMSAVAELRERFVDEIGGANADPSDPAYAERWQKAQPENDFLLRGAIGVNAFMRFQNEAP